MERCLTNATNFTKLARAISINMGFAGDIDNIISFHRGAIGMDKLMKHI